MLSEEKVIEVLRDVVDPELRIGIVDLGLLYRVEVRGDAVEVDVTMTYPGCPAEAYIRGNIVECLRERLGVTQTLVNTVWSPPWSPEFMSEEAKLSLGFPI